MLYLSCSEDGGIDKDLACLCLPLRCSAASEAEGVSASTIKNTTQSGEKHTLRPAVTLFATWSEIYAFAFLPFPIVTTVRS